MKRRCFHGLGVVLGVLLLAGVCGCEDGIDDNPSVAPAIDISGMWQLAGIRGENWSVEFSQDKEGRIAALSSDGRDWWVFNGWYVAPDTVNGTWDPKTGGQVSMTVSFVVVGNQLRGEWGQGMYGGVFSGVRTR